MVAYGLEILVGEIIKIISLVILSWLLGILPEVMTIAIIAAILRLASGGEHCSAYYRCLIGVTICFLALGCSVQLLTPLLTESDLYLIAIASSLLSLAVLHKYAPGDTENKPINNESERRKLKRLSILITILYFIIMIICSKYPSMRLFVLPIAVGMTEQVFTVSPWGYRFLQFVDRVLT